MSSMNFVFSNKLFAEVLRIPEEWEGRFNRRA